MSDHYWAQENLTSYVAGGLTPEERELFDNHLFECLDCQEAVKRTRDLDDRLMSLFASEKPIPGLEDRMIQALRSSSAQATVRLPFLGRLMLSVAALVLFTVLGALLSSPGSVQRNATADRALMAFGSVERDDAALDAKEYMVEPLEEITVPGPTNALENRGSNDVASPFLPPGLSSPEKEASHQYFKPEQLFFAQMPKDQPPPSPEASSKNGAKPGAPKPQTEPAQKETNRPDSSGRKIIYTGEMEFEVDQFESAVERVTKIVAEEKGFIATVNSEKLPNGKVRGTVVVRVPPDRLHTLVLKLRGLGDLKRQHLTSRDVTKLYTDLEGRLRAARTMEKRLLKIIEEGKGTIKDLLEVEKQLGEFRERIESLEGEIRYYSNLIALSTLTLTIYERQLEAAAAVTVTENVQVGIETDDVEKAYREVLASVEEAKGRITKSEFKKHAGGQNTAVIHFEVSPESAGSLRDRMKQMGRISRLDMDRASLAASATPLANAPVKRKNTRFFVSIYNLANVAPRQEVIVELAAENPLAVFEEILKLARKAGGQVVPGGRDERTAQSLRINVAAESADGFELQLEKLGELLTKRRVYHPDTDQYTDTKRGFAIRLFDFSQLQPGENLGLKLAVEDVAAGFGKLKDAAKGVNGRVISSQFSDRDQSNITAKITIDIDRDKRDAFRDALNRIGGIVSQEAIAQAKTQQQTYKVETKVRYVIDVIAQSSLPARQTHQITIEVPNVVETAKRLSDLVKAESGQIIKSEIHQRPDGETDASLVFDVSQADAASLVQQFKDTGKIRSETINTNPKVPDNQLARARIHLTLSNRPLVPSDKGLTDQMHESLSKSYFWLWWSIRMIIVGLAASLPWLVIAFILYRIFRRRSEPSTAS
ncbi:MAG: hypothetical protein KatS3mg105_2756 [Gemmatales bacterium]|nr:MAG: hypothetical protein KatS3mg105_2756 [Gemmatales bacterium]